MNQLEIKYFIPDKKREKNILLAILVVLTLVILTIVVIVQKPAPLSQNSASLLPTTQDNVLKKKRVRVSDSDDVNIKLDVNLLVGDELSLTLTVDDQHSQTWQLAKNFDRIILNLVEIRFHNAVQQTSLSNSSQEWRFEALKAGTIQLPFILTDLNSLGENLKTEVFKIRVR